MDMETTQKPESVVAKTPADGEEETIHKARSGAACDKSGGTYDRIVAYQRHGSFRFTDLPAEIRKLIFQLIASTFLHFDPESKMYSNHVIVGQYTPWKLRDENYMRVADEEESSRSTGNTWGAKLGWAYLEWVRGSANVSMQFRLELSSIIWERSRIYCRGDTKKPALGHFLTASPVITKGIKELVVDISLEDYLHLERDNNESIQSYNGGFQALMELISQKFGLECLMLRLSGTKSALFNLAEGEEGHTELDEDGYDLFRKADQQFKLTWEPKIREALLPDVLRPQTPKTDRNYYLEYREKEQEIGAIE
ncbi:hypothetical protein BHYA_0085g00310 [Botrytis hyacinthi]|uniref:Uncharacterized protein n=1 Tax=Botrytis hyacinthi TaxID=278943 RepID=A0A4Z1GLZ7_9HELO|nr:hypothetical protein BHYA_0085g00310 [Botrytis hyacinthi]